MGYSFGGYHAPRICAFEKRYAACVAFGAMHWSIYDWVAGNKAALAVDPRTSSTSIFQFRWVVGAPDNETALEWAKKFTLEGVAEKVAMPGADPARRERPDRAGRRRRSTLYERIGSKHKELRIFTAEEGGAEHCQVDNRQLGVDLHRRLAAEDPIARQRRPVTATVPQVRASRPIDGLPRPWSNGAAGQSRDGGHCMPQLHPMVRRSSCALASACLRRRRRRARIPTGRSASSSPSRRAARPTPSSGSSRNELGDRARRIDRDREQGRRRRLHRLADGRGLPERRLHGAGGRKRARHQPGAVQEASVGLQPAQGLRRGRRDGAARRWCGPSPTTCRPTRSKSSWPGRRPCRRSSTTATPGPAACRTSCPRSSSTAPACRRSRCRSAAAVRRQQAVAGGHVAVVASSLAGRQDPDRGQARQEPVRDERQAFAGACRTCRRSPETRLQVRRGGPRLLVGPVRARRARRSRSGPSSKRPCRPRWRTRPCASG